MNIRLDKRKYKRFKRIVLKNKELMGVFATMAKFGYYITDLYVKVGERIKYNRIDFLFKCQKTGRQGRCTAFIPSKTVKMCSTSEELFVFIDKLVDEMVCELNKRKADVYEHTD